MNNDFSGVTYISSPDTLPTNSLTLSSQTVGVEVTNPERTIFIAAQNSGEAEFYQEEISISDF